MLLIAERDERRPSQPAMVSALLALLSLSAVTSVAYADPGAAAAHGEEGKPAASSPGSDLAAVYGDGVSHFSAYTLRKFTEYKAELCRPEHERGLAQWEHMQFLQTLEHKLLGASTGGSSSLFPELTFLRKPSLCESRLDDDDPNAIDKLIDDDIFGDFIADQFFILLQKRAKFIDVNMTSWKPRSKKSRKKEMEEEEKRKQTRRPRRSPEEEVLRLLSS